MDEQSLVYSWTGASQEALVVKNLHTDAGDIRDVGSIPGSGRSPGGERGNPLQYSCLGNPMDRGTCGATIHGVAKSRTQFGNYTAAQHGEEPGIRRKG